MKNKASKKAKKELAISECINHLETLFNSYKNDSEFNYQLNNNDSPFNQLKKYLEVLEQYKKTEQELDIDLSLLLKVLKNGFYYKIWGNNIGDVEPGDINISIRNPFNEIYFVIQELAFEDTIRKEFYFDDYGKKWAFTENELKGVKNEE